MNTSATNNMILIVVIGMILSFQPGCNKQAEKDRIRQLEAENGILERNMIGVENELDKANASAKKYASELDSQRIRYEKQIAAERNKAKQHADRLVESAKNDADVFKSAMDNQDKRIASLVEENKNLKQELESVKSTVEKLASRNETDDAGSSRKIDPRVLAQIVKVYGHYWSKAKAELSAGHEDREYLKDLQRRNFLSGNYTNCIAQAIKLCKIASGDTSTSGETWSTLDDMYKELLNQRWSDAPWDISSYTRRPPSYNQFHGKSVDQLSQCILTELKEQQKQIQGIVVTRKSVKNYRVKWTPPER